MSALTDALTKEVMKHELFNKQLFPTLTGKAQNEMIRACLMDMLAEKTKQDLEVVLTALQALLVIEKAKSHA
jgi:hypothetical protein